MNFSEAPALGTVVKYWRGVPATLVGISQRVKADGAPGNLLTWRFPDGRVATSGLRSKSVTWVNSKEARP